MSDPATTRPAAAGGPATRAVLPSSLQGHPPPQPASAFTSHPAAAGVALTRAPWATGGADPMAATRMPVGFSRGGIAIQPPAVQQQQQAEKVDFDTVRQQHPEYAAAGSSASATAGTAAAAASPSSTGADQYGPPFKVIKTPAYLPLFKQTTAYAELTGFILLLNDRVRGVKVQVAGAPGKKYAVSEKVRALCEWLRECRQTIATIPPIQQAMRYGNAAFRTWHAACLATDKLCPMLQRLVGPELTARGADRELAPYLQDAFGSLQRIDYGTGHELNFVLCLAALHKLQVFGEEDHQALVCEVFRTYVELMQTLQTTYWLEPAGSKGAWGLDDYCFLPFLWGSSQLLGSSIKPGDILDPNVVESGADRYLYLLAIHFIHRVKKGPFHEHSAYLHQIAQLPSWQKANSGLILMYEEEVLNKFPIVQHILFGRLLPFTQFRPGDRLGITDALEKLQMVKKTSGGSAAAPSTTDAAAEGGPSADRAEAEARP